MAPAGAKKRVLLIGGQFTGNFCARELKKKFYVTVVDCKEYFEYTPGVLRAFVRPAHLDSLTFTLQPVYERKMGVKFIWGEVKELNGDRKTVSIKPICSNNMEEVGFDYCIICSGCNFGPFKPMGESLWFPTVHEEARGHSDWKHIDERYLEGRRRHVLEEYQKLHDLNKKQSTVLIVGAGFIGVEWATELEHFFPQLKLTIIDFLPRCLGPLPDGAAEYCSEYMSACGIKEFYNCKYDPKNPEFWKQIELPNGADEIYVCIGVKASNYFMPAETLSDKGPGGGGWIHFNKHMQVTKKPSLGGAVWADGSIYAVGDCNYGCIGEPGKWEMPPVPKISYPGEEQAYHACLNVMKMADGKDNLVKTWWPWGAGMFATSLGPHDACFVTGGGSVHELLGQNMWMLISVCIGFISALVGFVFSRVFHYVHKFMNWIPLPRWLLFGIVGGLVACIGSAVYHATGLRGVWGIGVNSLKLALEQDFQGHAGYLLIFALGKLAAFALSVSLRFPGDTLEPVLIAGAFLGGAIGKHLPIDVVGESNSPCVIFGMVGLFASCFRFPLTPVVIVLELTGTRTYNIILPVALSSFTALSVSNHLFPPILEQILHQDDIDLEAVAELAEIAEEEEELMTQFQMQRNTSVQSLNMSEASGISVASKGPLGGLVNRLEDSMMVVSSRRRRMSLMSKLSMTSSRSGRNGGRGIRRLSMNSRMSLASRPSATGTGSRSPTTPTHPESPKAKKRPQQDSPEHSGAAVGTPVSAVSPSRWSLQTALGPLDEPESGDEIPQDRPGIARENEEIEEVEAETAAVCCDAFPM